LEADRSKPDLRLRWVTGAMFAVVLAGGLGFVYKIVQFTKKTQGFEGAAFIVPVLVYLTMALGFAFLLAWAICRGMFHNLEGPKYRMLEREEDYEHRGI
jgi:hypothetical protein